MDVNENRKRLYLYKVNRQECYLGSMAAETKTVFTSILVYLISIILGCTPTHESPYLEYANSFSNLSQGIVHKYYEATYPKGQTDRGNVFYIKYKIENRDTLIQTKYNAAKEVTSQSKYLLIPEGKKWTSSFFINRNEKIPFEIITSETQNWTKGDTFSNHYKYDFNGQSVVQFSRDSIVSEEIYLKRPCIKVVRFTKQKIYSDSELTGEYSWSGYKLYSKDLGLIFEERQYDNSRTTIELIKQMSIEDFQAIKITYAHRIAHIDPNESWSPDAFDVCHDQSINDYYNWDTPELLEGKRELKDFVRARYNASKYPDESGYLSIHFVINCRGEAGRYIDHSHSLDYKEDHFSEEIKEDLMSIIKEKKGWVPQINTRTGEHVNVYHYITFRIVNGHIDEFLP